MDDPTFTSVPAAAAAVGVRLRVTPTGEGAPWSRSAALPEPGAWEDPAAILLDRAREEGAIQPGARVRLEWLDADGRPVGSRQKTIPGEPAASSTAAAAALAGPAGGAELDTFGAALAGAASHSPAGPVVPLAAVAIMGAAMGQLAAALAGVTAENTRATRAALDAATAQGAELRRLAGAAIEGAGAAHQLAIGQALEAGEARAAAAAATAAAEHAGSGEGAGEPSEIVQGIQAAAELAKSGAELVGQLSGRRPASADTIARVVRGILARPEDERRAALAGAMGALSEGERGQLAAELMAAMGSAS
jgi:hypothetical protein